MLSPDFASDNGTIEDYLGSGALGHLQRRKRRPNIFKKYFNISYMHVISQAKTYMQTMFHIVFLLQVRVLSCMLHSGLSTLLHSWIQAGILSCMLHSDLSTLLHSCNQAGELACMLHSGLSTLLHFLHSGWSTRLHASIQVWVLFWIPAFRLEYSPECLH